MHSAYHNTLPTSNATGNLYPRITALMIIDYAVPPYSLVHNWNDTRGTFSDFDDSWRPCAVIIGNTSTAHSSHDKLSAIHRTSQSTVQLRQTTIPRFLSHSSTSAIYRRRLYMAHPHYALSCYELLDVLPTHDKDLTYYTMHGTCSPCHRARICDSFATVCQYTVYYRSIFPHLLSLLHKTQLNGSIVYHVRISQVGSFILVSPCPTCTTYNVTVR